MGAAFVLVVILIFTVIGGRDCYLKHEAAKVVSDEDAFEHVSNLGLTNVTMHSKRLDNIDFYKGCSRKDVTYYEFRGINKLDQTVVVELCVRPSRSGKPIFTNP
jgi:hypothetical protein